MAIIRDKCLLVVRKKGMSAFILPGGKPEPNEKERVTLQRELQEELGVVVTFARFEGSFEDKILADSNDTIKVQLYRGLIHGIPTPQAEIEEIAWLPLLKPYTQEVTPSMSNKIIPYLSAKVS